jgi:hypothetical protein
MYKQNLHAKLDAIFNAHVQAELAAEVGTN